MRYCWYQLVDASGSPFKKTSADALMVFPVTLVFQFRKALKESQPEVLLGIASSQLAVYKNKSCFDEKTSLEPDVSVADFGRSRAEALWIAVPSSSPMSSPVPLQSPSLMHQNQNDIKELKEDFKNFKETIRKYIQQAESIQMSDLTMEKLTKDGFTIISTAVKSVEDPAVQLPDKFEWPVPNQEANQQNKDAYLGYLSEFAKSFEELRVTTSIDAPHLNAVFGARSHHYKGTADLYVVPRSADLLCRTEISMVFEMKCNTVTANNLAQGIGYVIAANILFDRPGRPGPVGVVTDFKDQWYLIWIGKEGHIFYASTEESSSGITALTRRTALNIIHEHMDNYNRIISLICQSRQQRHPVRDLSFHQSKTCSCIQRVERKQTVYL